MRTATRTQGISTLSCLIAALLSSGLCVAAEPTVQGPTEAATEPPVPPAPPAKKPPYSLPWQLRPVVPVKVVRIDNMLDFNSTSTANVLIINGLYTFDSRFMALARVGAVFNAPSSGTGAAGSFLNVLLGGQYLHTFGPVKVAGFLGLTLPTAGGGGNAPNALQKVADGVGIYARSSMDNAMFSANDLTVIPGIGAAWVGHGFTVQAEATLLELIRVKGEAVQADTAKTNFTTGLHVGYFFVPQLSMGAELRYQRWLTTPAAVAKDETLRHNLNGAVGLRAHISLGPVTLRPGVSVSHGLVGSMLTAQHTTLQLDVPIAF